MSEQAAIMEQQSHILREDADAVYVVSYWREGGHKEILGFIRKALSVERILPLLLPPGAMETIRDVMPDGSLKYVCISWADAEFVSADRVTKIYGVQTPQGGA